MKTLVQGHLVQTSLLTVVNKKKKNNNKKKIIMMMIYCRVSSKVTEALHLQYLHYKSTLRKKH